MAKKQEAEKELKAKEAELGTVTATAEKETIESEADSISIEDIKSQIVTTPDADFDWDADDKKFGNYSDSEREKMEKLYDGTFSSITKGEIITGTVVSVNNKDVVLNIGFKSDGLVSVSEFRDTPDLKIGDQVDVFVESQEDANGQLVLSRKRAKTQKSWEKINSALDNDEIITGFVKSRTKGGLIVDIMGVEAFLPGSQIDIKPIRDYDVYVGKTMEFKVVKINHEFKNVVVSHKVLIEDDLENQKTEIVAKLEKGQVLEGTVKNITDFGVFIDLGGVDGLLHITDISWGRIEHPREVLSLDQKINVVVLDFDDEKKRIALGLKQLNPHPWQNRDERKMSLGIKQLTPDPWQNAAERYAVGTQHIATVKNMTNFGVFVELEDGIDGLIHISDLSWSKKINHPNEFTKVGEKLNVVVLELDVDNRKLSLGHKQLEENPWDTFETIFTIDSIHEGTVVKVTDKGAVIALPYGVEGFVPTKHMAKEDGSVIKAEETNDFKIIEFNKDAKRIVVSHARIWEEAKAEAVAEERATKKKEAKASSNAVKKVKDSVEKSTLGDLSVLAQLKEQMEGEESKNKSK